MRIQHASTGTVAECRLGSYEVDMDGGGRATVDAKDLGPISSRIRVRRLLIERDDTARDPSWQWLATRSSPRRLEARLKDEPDAATDVDQHGWTLLHHAAAGGCLDHARILVEYSDVNRPEGMHGWTPVHVAMIGRHTEVVDLLLDRGARKSPDKYGWQQP